MSEETNGFTEALEAKMMSEAEMNTNYFRPVRTIEIDTK